MLAQRLGGAALTGVGTSVALMMMVGVWRSPAAVPRLDGPGLLPELSWSPASDLGVTVILWIATLTGTAGVAAGLIAVRRGWRPRMRRLAVGAIAAVAALAIAPPMGSTDSMDYAVYGRMVVVGQNPHVMTPGQFRATGDPVGLLAPLEWDDLPSVYGPLATAGQWAAAELGRGSAAWTILWIKVWNGLAFLAVALALTRLAGPDLARRIRVQVLWTLNPLMLWALIGGAHVDVLAAAFAVAGLGVLGRSATAHRGLAGGLLLGAAAAVKAPYLLLGTGLGWALRRSRWGLAGALIGGAAVLATGYAVIGPGAVEAVLHRGGLPSWNTPWELLVPLDHGHQPPSWLITWGSLALAAALTAIFLRGLPEGPPWLRPALAVSLAWVLTTPVYYPWYEALVFPLIALAPASRLDWLQLLRALVATGGCLPGVVFRLGNAWLKASWMLTYAVPAALLVLAIALVGAATVRATVTVRTRTGQITT